MAPSKIEDISSEASWIDEREDGGLVFERARVRTSRGYYWNMTDRARAALALTEGCTRRGRGKVCDNPRRDSERRLILQNRSSSSLQLELDRWATLAGRP